MAPLVVLIPLLSFAGSVYCQASKMRLKGVSVARRNSLKPPARTTSRIADSGATAPSAGPPSAIELEVQQSVDAPAKVRPMMLKFSSTVFPAIGSTISALPTWPRLWPTSRKARWFLCTPISLMPTQPKRSRIARWSLPETRCKL